MHEKTSIDTAVCGNTVITA